ncbi:hypothetical protein AAX10_00355 [Moraxella bovoculi]|nr:hypothetical protein AAX10_00355 [Moraxella bovoculi]
MRDATKRQSPHIIIDKTTPKNPKKNKKFYSKASSVTKIYLTQKRCLVTIKQNSVKTYGDRCPKATHWALIYLSITNQIGVIL